MDSLAAILNISGVSRCSRCGWEEPFTNLLQGYEQAVEHQETHEKEKVNNALVA